MPDEHETTLRIRTSASAYCCECCPPERACAWACLQGAGVEEIVIGAALALEGVPGAAVTPGADPAHAAMWDSFNGPAAPATGV